MPPVARAIPRRTWPPKNLAPEEPGGSTEPFRPNHGLLTAILVTTAPIAPTFAQGETPEKPKSEAPAKANPAEEQDGPRIQATGSAEKKAPEPRAARGAKRAIDIGLSWLAKHQDANGRWDSDKFDKHDPEDARSGGAGMPTGDVGATALALRCFLAAGSPSDAYSDTTERALRWLISQQRESGMIGSKATHSAIYGHAIASVALCELLTSRDKDDPLHKLARTSAQKAIDHLARRRNPYGAWRYYPRDGSNDTSVTYWCATAYGKARDAGLHVEKNGLEFARTYIESVTDPATGHVGYTKRGEDSSRDVNSGQKFPPDLGAAMTAAGICVQHTSGRPKAEMIALGSEILAEKPPVETDEARDFVHWYLGTDAMQIIGGEMRKRWTTSLVRAAVATQETRGTKHGSWNPESVWGHYGGRVGSTALVVRALQMSAAPANRARDAKKAKAKPRRHG